MALYNNTKNGAIFHCFQNELKTSYYKIILSRNFHKKHIYPLIIKVIILIYIKDSILLNKKL